MTSSAQMSENGNKGVWHLTTAGPCKATACMDADLGLNLSASRYSLCTLRHIRSNSTHFLLEHFCRACHSTRASAPGLVKCCWCAPRSTMVLPCSLLCLGRIDNNSLEPAYDSKLLTCPPEVANFQIIVNLGENNKGHPQSYGSNDRELLYQGVQEPHSWRNKSSSSSSSYLT